MTGVLFIAAALLLIAFIHIAVVFLAAVLMGVVGVSSVKAALRARRPVCPHCRTRH